MTLARTSTPITIQVPKQADVSRSESGLNITYSKGVAATPYTNLWQTVMFEDSKVGDFDYNDIIIHANYQTSGDNLSIGIQPIALGSTKNIRLGFLWSKGGEQHEVIVADNCRNDLFEGKAGFINTNKYDKHYSGFTKNVDIDMSGDSSTGALNITWFIDVDNNNLRLYTANKYSYKSIDKEGRPYGFALTDCGGSNSGGTTYNPSAETTAAWNALMPDLAWTVMPAQPTIPADAVSMDTYADYLAGNNKNYILESGKTFSKSIQFVSGVTYYVQGKLSINSFYGSNGTIIVLPGGEISFDKKSASLQGVTIYNYGTLSTTVSNVLFGNNSIVVSNGNFNFENTDITLDNSGKVCINGDVVAKSLSVSGTSNFVSNSIEATAQIYTTNYSYILSRGGINTKGDIKIDSNGRIFADCSVMCNNVDISSSQLMVATYLSAKNITLRSTGSVYVKAGGMIDTPNYTATNSYNVGIKCIGNEMAVVNTENISLTGNVYPYKTFQGNLGVMFNKLLEGKKTLEGGLSNSRVSQDGNVGNVIFNSSEVTAPVIEGCSPGYNTDSTEDEGLGWFSYPLEGTNINSCYDFEKWRAGNIDLTLKDTARVFDITNTNPVEGNKIEIFNIK